MAGVSDDGPAPDPPSSEAADAAAATDAAPAADVAPAADAVPAPDAAPAADALPVVESPLDLSRHRRRAIGTALPAVAFVVANAVSGLRAAIVATTVVSIVAVALRQRRRERLGLGLPPTTPGFVGPAPLGAATGSKDRYVGPGIGGAVGL